MNLSKSSQGAHFLSACIILGFSSMAAQIILFREFMVAFYGNELTLGIMLAVWLFWVGLGSTLGNRIATGRTLTPRRLSWWYLLISLFTIAAMVLIRFSKQILGTAPAEIVGFVPMLLFGLLVLAPLCLILGITFVLNSKAWAFDETRVFAVHRVYLWESLGAALAGFGVTFILIPSFSNFTIAYMLIVLNLAFFATLLFRRSAAWARLAAVAVTVLVIGGLFASNSGRWLDRYTAARMWRSLPLVFSEDSRYGNIAVTKQQEQITFYENGLMLFSSPDDFSAEEAVHFALLEHPHPRSLLLIGGGMGGALAQALKYDSLRIDYAELDPELIRIGKSYLPETEVGSLENPRVVIHLVDGRLYVRQNLERDQPARYDVVILNLPDPSTAQLNRFYTGGFFSMVRTALNPDGVFSFRVTSAENYISDELGLYLSSLFRTLASVFEEVKVLPGGNAIFLASGKRNVLFDDWQTLVSRLKQRSIKTSFVNESFLPDRLSAERLALIYDALLGERGRINSDLEPVCYFYNSILWSKQFKSVEKPLLLYLSGVKRLWFVVVLGFAFVLVFLLSLSSRSRSSKLALATILVAGFTSILVEIILVLCFQILYGYIYSMIGLIFTLFMLGLFLGAAIIQRRALRREISFRILTGVQLLQVVFLLVLLILIRILAGTSIPETAIAAILLLMISASGFLGGMLFALGNHLFVSRRSTRKAGTGYAVDLFGSALGSLLASAILIPLLGIPTLLGFMVSANLICLFSLLIAPATG
jgi:spermidine synthase